MWDKQYFLFHHPLQIGEKNFARKAKFDLQSLGYDGWIFVSKKVNGKCIFKQNLHFTLSPTMNLRSPTTVMIYKRIPTREVNGGH